MRKFLFVASAFALSACAQVQPGTVPAVYTTQGGQLFCHIQQAGGGTIAVGLVDVAAGVYVPAAAPGIGIGAAGTKSYLDSNCAAAAVKLGGTSLGAIPAPAMPVQPVAIVPVAPASK